MKDYIISERKFKIGDEVSVYYYGEFQGIGVITNISRAAIEVEWEDEGSGSVIKNTITGNMSINFLSPEEEEKINFIRLKRQNIRYAESAIFKIEKNIQNTKKFWNLSKSEEVKNLLSALVEVLGIK